MTEITVTELKRMRDANEPHQLIDVREEFEYELANIRGELIPMGTIPEHLDKISKNKPVIIHCKSGKRSATIVQYLEQQEYTNVSNLKGGILGWIDEIDPSLTKY